MASVILRGFGSLVGTAMGGPIGGMIGSTIGGFIGGSIDSAMRGPTERHVSGPRLSNLSIQTSSYGRAIPLVFGECRLAGNIIWALPIKEHKHVTETEVEVAKGEDETIISTEYSYSATLAIAICKGSIDLITNIWADAKIITNELRNIKIYKGNEDQMPDPTIEAHMGVGRTPAYRGLAYVVIEDLPLEEYGNRIPNFSFEVRRRPSNHILAKEPNPEDMLEAICMIPGSGEFVYDTKIQYKVSGDQSGQVGKAKSINMNNMHGKADCLVSLDQMQDTCPNIKWVAPVVTWFATSLDINKCKIFPGVEFKDVHTTPDVWQVEGKHRAQGYQITLKDKRPVYGGTVSDASVLRYLDELRRRNYKIMLYPMMFLDVPAKPWRGHMSGSAEEVRTFFEKEDGYNNFIIHYANLVRGKVDAFVIGSELKNITKIKDQHNQFPATDFLINLARKVKAILGPAVKITYAADWSEYHHTEGGWYSLDKLWACDAIDVIGIDAYFPLTEDINYMPTDEEIIKGWESAEGYDYYFEGNNRSKKHPLICAYAWKNIKWWWENEHVNPDGKKTEWVPKSKKIWFTEFGFPSVDGASNQPNVFYDPECFDGGLPRKSRGMTDFRSQRNAIKATLKYWQNSEMVEQLFLWTWDARPYPYWPSMKHVWADGNKWSKGHWVNGKFGVTSLADALLEICTEAGIDSSKIDVSDITEFVSGYVLNHIDSARSIIENLAKAYFFTLIESDGKIKFVSQRSKRSHKIDKNDLIYRGSQLINITRKKEQDLPKRVEIIYLDKANYYQQNMVRNENYQTTSNKSVLIDSGLVLDQEIAENVAHMIMYNYWSMRHDFEFHLPFKYIFLEPGDLITLEFRRLRITKISLVKNNVLELSATSDDVVVDDYIYEPKFNIKSEGYDQQNYVVHIIDLHPKIAAYDTKAVIHVAIANITGSFRRASIYYEDNGYKPLSVVIEESIIGVINGKLLDASPDVFDLESKVEVSLISGVLFSVEFDDAINRANVAVIGNEVVQFMNAKLISPGKYELSRFLRGRMGTENLVNGHADGERFILLDGKIKAIEIPINRLEIEQKFKVVAAYENVDEAEERLFKWQANSIKPLSVAHLTYEFIGEKLIKLTWFRRAKINGDWRNKIDVPLDEQEESYEIDIIINSVVIDTIMSKKSECVIDISKYNFFPTFYVYQLSSIVGRGDSMRSNI